MGAEEGPPLRLMWIVLPIPMPMHHQHRSCVTATPLKLARLAAVAAAAAGAAWPQYTRGGGRKGGGIAVAVTQTCR